MPGAADDIRPGRGETGLLAVIGVGHGLPFPTRHMIEQQRQVGRRVRGPHRRQIDEILLVERDDVAEPVEVRRRHLPGAMIADVDAMRRGDALGADVGRMADVPIAGSGGLDPNVEPALPCRLDHRRLGQGRAADIAEADEQHRRPLARIVAHAG